LPDVVEIACAGCRRVSEAAQVPGGSFRCPSCGVMLDPVVVTSVHRVATTLVRTDFDEDDLTPVADVVPLPPVGGKG
jgi:PHP family Zn ribbon phosphoesterase